MFALLVGACRPAAPEPTGRGGLWIGDSRVADVVLWSSPQGDRLEYRYPARPAHPSVEEVRWGDEGRLLSWTWSSPLEHLALEITDERAQWKRTNDDGLASGELPLSRSPKWPLAPFPPSEGTLYDPIRREFLTGITDNGGWKTSAGIFSRQEGQWLLGGAGEIRWAGLDDPAAEPKALIFEVHGVFPPQPRRVRRMVVEVAGRQQTIVRPDPLELPRRIEGAPEQAGDRLFSRPVATLEWPARAPKDAEPLKRVEAMIGQIRERVEVRDSPDAPVVSRVVERGWGDCDDLAELFVALAPSYGLHARAVRGLLLTERGWVLHGWNEVWFGERGWVAVDPSLNQPLADAGRVVTAYLADVSNLHRTLRVVEVM